SLACAPTAVAALQLRGQVPVIQRRVRLDIAREQPIDEPFVESETCFVDCTAPGRLDPRPRDGEAISAHAEMRDQVQVGLEPVVVIARDVAIAAVGDRARHTAELVPDGGSLAIRARRTLDLERTGRDAPDKVR